ncbi:MAG TPA: tetraacyldisaccharide 4'-kinase [Smithella sp.]|nr:tetraacyldisaccharide 4'-kinase [Smithella sp.]
MKIMTDWPRIWDDDGSTKGYGALKIVAHILSFFYLFIVYFRNWLYDYKILKEARLACPVISVGNITVGGTGKTPCVILLARMLQEKGFKPAVISRGYGGRKTGPANVVSDGHNILLDSEIAGDEPVLLAHRLKGVPVITGAKRTITGKTAIEKFGADVLLCDDAMQHRQIFRDVNLVLLDSKAIKGNHHVLPRGKLREPIKGIRRASAVLFTRADETTKTDETLIRLIHREKIPVFKSIHRIEDMLSGDEKTQKPASALEGKTVYAFCGIANPDSFKKTLLNAKIHLIALDVFQDHHPYREQELAKIRSNFVQSGADYLMTTEKDAMRLQKYPDFLKELFMLRIKMEIQPSSQGFENFIMEKIGH